MAQCKCAKRFQVEQIGENKYRVRKRKPVLRGGHSFCAALTGKSLTRQMGDPSFLLAMLGGPEPVGLDMQCLALISAGARCQVSCGLRFRAPHSCIWKIVPYLVRNCLYEIQQRRHFRALSSLLNRSLWTWRHLYHKIRNQLSNDWPLPPRSWSS